MQLLWFNDKKLWNYSLQISHVTYESSFKYKEISKCVVISKTRNEATFKTKKAANMKEIRAELQGAMGGRHHTIIDDEEEESDENVYMYPADMHLDEQDEYQEAKRASKATE